jgi:hypothetical protein
MRSTPELEQKLQELASQGILEPRTENNAYLKVSYRGTGTLVSPKWNIKIYTSGSVVCTDGVTLNGLITGSLKAPESHLKIIQIDDAGCGFPLCGVMVGACCDGRIVTDVVPVSYFQGDFFTSHDYLRDYSNRGYAMITREFNPSVKTHRIEICTGFINKNLKALFRQKEYDVRAVEIKGLLQDSLEGIFREHVKKETGIEDLAYDPKGLTKRELCFQYYKALNWGKEFAPHLLKSGWKSMKEEN